MTMTQRRRFGTPNKAEAKKVQFSTNETSEKSQRRFRPRNLKNPNSPLEAIRQKCLDCCCWQWVEVRECTSLDCSLHGFRFGKRPSTIAKRQAKQEASA